MKKSLFRFFSCALVFVWAAAGSAGAATYTVTSSTDGAPGSLRSWITVTNSNANLDIINFNMAPNTAIQLIAQIDITAPVIINGAGTTINAGSAQAFPLLVLAAGSGGSLIRDLALLRADNGLRIESDGNTVWGCSLGINWVDTVDANNYGIYLTGSDNMIGGPSAYQRNVVSGNLVDGIYAFDTDRLIIQNNYIGLNRPGSSARSNGSDGMRLINSDTCLIGGDRGTGEGNVISGNIRFGVYIQGGAYAGNTVCGNIIGLRANQASAVGNTLAGIHINGSAGNFIGLPLAGYGNIVAGNVDYGISVPPPGSITRNLTVQNNIIGMNESGTIIPNGYGLRINSLQDSLIGGYLNESYLQRNFISGNTRGISVTGNCAGTVISGNYIGTSFDGLSARANTNGIYLANANIHIGGITVLGSGDKLGNIISGNTVRGIDMATASGNTIVGNFIGVDVSGNVALSNGNYGIYLGAGSNRNIIGSAWTAPNFLGNVISGNINEAGIYIYNSAQNYLAGNYIGLSSTGINPVPNDRGIYLSGSLCRLNQIGGPTNQERNFIGGNTYQGIYITSNTVTGNIVQNNYLGSNAFGAAYQPNGTTDIRITNGVGNLIQDNYLTGYLLISSASSVGNSVVGNSIGRLPALGSPTNPTYGIRVETGASYNFLGEPPGGGGGNDIRNATTAGVSVDGASTDGNGIFGNVIRDCAANISLTSFGNNNKAAPEITSAMAWVAVAGTAGPNDFIEVFIAESPSGNGGSLSYVTYTWANGAGNWSVNPGSLLSGGEYVTALATDTSNNTSSFAANYYVAAATPTFTSTPTVSPTITPSPTITLTGTASPTSTLTITGTPTISPTATHSPTITPTPTISATYTITLTSTTTPTSTSTPDNPLLGADLGGKAALAMPNPARNSMQFVLHLDQTARVEIMIFNLAGERVAGLSENLPAGRGQSLLWDCSDVAPGVYVARVLKNGKEEGKLKVAVVK